MPDVKLILLIYIVGVIVGVAKVDASPVRKVGWALLWPLGPLAFVLTLAVLLAASLVAFPWVGAAALAAALYYSAFSR